jgi:hypothetical protein
MLVLAGVLLFTAAYPANCQKIVDKTVATVSDGVRTELITLSDLRWQIALQPGSPVENPTSEELNRALELMIQQSMFFLEAERLPRLPPERDEISAKIAEIMKRIGPAAEFERRLKVVGFTSVDDENFREIIRKRVVVDKYLDFRFKSFIVVTAADEAEYYRETFVPDFRRRFPGLLMPALEEKRGEIREAITQDRLAANIETFLDEAKRRVEIVYLLPV